MIDPSDPPVYMENLREASMGTRGDILHHPAHAIYLKKFFDRMEVPSTLVISETPGKDREDMLDFFFRYLLEEGERSEE